MLFKKQNILPIILGKKTKTLRKPNYKIKANKRHKFICNFSDGSFGDAFVYHTEIINISEISDELAVELGFASADEYLAQGYNVDAGNKRLLICFKDFQLNPNWKGKIND